MSAYSTVTHPRRYYLLKKQAARALYDDGLAMLWQFKQESESGTDLPDDFPNLTALDAAGYSTIEDLTGAGSIELMQEVGLTHRQADAVIAALAAL